MPETTTANPGTINRESWSNDITLLEPQKYPYTSAVQKTGEAIGMSHETFTDRLDRPRLGGAREGGATGQGGNKLKDIKRHGAYQNFKQRQWAVTHHMQLIGGRGGLAGVPSPVDRSEAHCESELKRDMEFINLSNQDTQNGNGGSADMLTRGAVKWLTPQGTALGTAGSVGYVDPTAQATTASVLYHGNTAAPLFSETQLNGLLKEMSTIRGSAESFDGFFGVNVVETLDLFSRIASPSVTVNPGTAQFYTTRQGNNEHTLSLMVNIYKTSFGMLNSIMSMFVNGDDNTGLGDPNAGLILDLDLWSVDVLENIHEAENWKRATEEGGVFQATWINLCHSPRGNGLTKKEP